MQATNFASFVQGTELNLDASPNMDILPSDVIGGCLWQFSSSSYSDKKIFEDKDIPLINSFLTKHTEITSLNLRSNNMTETGTTSLRGVNLKSINLSRNSFTAGSILNLDGVPNLTSLNLSENDIDNASVESITKLTNLEHLNVIRTRINDAGIKILRENLATLKKINASNS